MNQFQNIYNISLAKLMTTKLESLTTQLIAFILTV